MRQSKKIYGLIGRNVDYSWSPLIHNTAFEALGLPCFYTIFNIADPESIREALLGAKALGIGGFNVTIPYKKTVVPFMDNLSAEAATIGAVNTIVIRDGTLSGHNTDIEGFAAPLRPFADRISGKKVCIFGNGGAALAAIEAFRLFFNPEEIILFVRNPEKAATMLEGYPHEAMVTISLQKEKIEQVRECRVVVNATPIGTKGRLNDPVSSIVPLGKGLIHRDQIVYDMVYNPLETPLLSHAAALGATTIGGLEMLLGQAARSFFIWTAQELPEETIKRYLMQEIAKGS